MTEWITESYEETLEQAAAFAAQVPAGSVIALLGGLGAGKTAFTAGFVKGLGITDDVTSPTFALCNAYRGNGKCVYHFDMYRIEGWDDLDSTGFFDYLQEDAYIVVEWSENIFEALPPDSYIIEIEQLGEQRRRFRRMKKDEV